MLLLATKKAIGAPGTRALESLNFFMADMQGRVPARSSLEVRPDRDRHVTWRYCRDDDDRAAAMSQIAAAIAASAIGPAVSGITLGLVRQAGFNCQNGRNQAFNHAGNMVGAGLQSVAVSGLVARILDGSGRVKVGQGAVMTVQGLGASLSPSIGGWIAQWLGYPAMFLILGSFALASIALWVGFGAIVKPACA